MYVNCDSPSSANRAERVLRDAGYTPTREKGHIHSGKRVTLHVVGEVDEATKTHLRATAGVTIQ